MEVIMNKKTVEVSIKEQLAQLISKYNASQQGLRHLLSVETEEVPEPVGQELE